MVNPRLVLLTLSATGSGFCLVLDPGFPKGDCLGPGESDSGFPEGIIRFPGSPGIGSSSSLYVIVIVYFTMMV